MSRYVKIQKKERATDPRGIVYLLHFDRPLVGERRNPDAKKFAIARHYIGWTASLDDRLDAHRRGVGSALMAAVAANGISWTVARLWDDSTRTRERQLKNQGAVKLCPVCRKGAA